MYYKKQEFFNNELQLHKERTHIKHQPFLWNYQNFLFNLKCFKTLSIVTQFVFKKHVFLFFEEFLEYSKCTKSIKCLVAPLQNWLNNYNGREQKYLLCNVK